MGWLIFEQTLDVTILLSQIPLVRWLRGRLVKEIGAPSWEEARTFFRQISPIHLAVTSSTQISRRYNDLGAAGAKRADQFLLL
jgi:hypothetical protein